MQENDIFADVEIIDMYSTDEAADDGFMVKTEDIHPEMQKSFFSHISTNLLNQGYFAPKDSERKDIGPLNLIIPNMVELLTQVQNIIVGIQWRQTNRFFLFRPDRTSNRRKQ